MTEMQTNGTRPENVNPNPEILQYTRIKKSPYFYGSRRHGVAMYSVYNHHYHPRTTETRSPSIGSSSKA